MIFIASFYTVHFLCKHVLLVKGHDVLRKYCIIAERLHAFATRRQNSPKEINVYSLDIYKFTFRGYAS